jgi:hypothetical protein
MDLLSVVKAADRLRTYCMAAFATVAKSERVKRPKVCCALVFRPSSE